MDKRSRIEAFLDYGGSELFSSLMGTGMVRSVGIDRLIILLEDYSDRCRWIRGRSGAYRYMIKRAQRRGWLGVGSEDLKSHRLEPGDRDFIRRQMEDYLTSGGRAGELCRRAAIIAAVCAAAGLLFFGVWRYMQTDEYKRRFADANESLYGYTGSEDPMESEGFQDMSTDGSEISRPGSP